MTGHTAAEIADRAMTLLLAGDHPHLQTLRTQYDAADADIDITGSGFYVEFDVPDRTDRLPVTDRFHFGDVEASATNSRYGMGFVLFVDDGILTLLEGYTYDDDFPTIRL